MPRTWRPKWLRAAQSGCWEPSLSPVLEQHVLLITELAVAFLIFLKKFFFASIGLFGWLINFLFTWLLLFLLI